MNYLKVIQNIWVHVPKEQQTKKSEQKQYYSEIPAKRRAILIKTIIHVYVINNYVVGQINTYDSILKNTELKEETFDNVVLNKINEYKGKTEEELYSQF